jgi:phosphoserine phosphatase
MNESRRLVVSIDDQTLRLIEGSVCLREFPVSTSIKGMGFTKDSCRTPVGNFRICEKIGAGQPNGTIFKARVPVGQWHLGESPDADLVLTRILRLDGLDFSNANTLDRCVYIHGTNREDMIGQPAGHGCVRLCNDDMIDLFDMVEENDLLVILPATRRRGKLLFISFESLIHPLNGVIEMARLRGDLVQHEVMKIIEERLSAGEVFRQCMEAIRPDRGLCETMGEICAAALAPQAAEFISTVKADGWLPVLLTRCPAPLVVSVARELGITHDEAPLLDFHDDGSYAGSGRGYPMTGNFQQAGVIRDWLESVLPERVAMIGDQSVDHETRAMVDIMMAPDLICDDGFEGLAGILKVFPMEKRS